MSKRARIERIKTLLIVLLTISAVAMVWKLFSGADVDFSGGFLAPSENKEDAQRSEGYVQCAKPFAVAVTDSSGERRGERYSETSVNELYARFSAALAEALGSTGEPERVDFSEWEDALSSPGVYFDFIYSQPLRAVAAWLGAEMSGEAAGHAAARLCLAQMDDGVYLYYLRTKDANAYRCSTFASLPELSGTAVNDAMFAFESGLREIDPYTLLIGELPDFPEVSVSNPLRFSVQAEELMEAFGMNSFVAQPYGEGGGKEAYVDGDSTLRLDPDGRISFRQTGAVEADTVDGQIKMEDVIDSAFRLVDRVTSAARGSASIGLSSVEYSEAEGSFSIRFEYRLDGLFIEEADGSSAAVVTVVDGQIVQADILLREYSVQSTSQTALPEKQAAALLAVRGGGEPMLCFMDSGDHLTLEWVSYER